MIPNPYVLIAIVLAWLASLAGVGAWQRHDGAASTVAAYEKRDNEALIAANATIERLNNEARDREAHHAADLAAIGEDYAAKLEANDAQRRVDVAAAHAGRIVLRVPGICPPGAGAAPETPAPAGRGDGPQDGELPGALAAALLELAADADRNTRQLSACQAVIASDREGAKP
jgi:hypothetical protein